MKKVCLFGVSLLSVAILGACSSGTSTESSNSSSSSSTTEQTSSSSSQSTYNVGDTITFEDEVHTVHNHRR